MNLATVLMLACLARSHENTNDIRFDPACFAQLGEGDALPHAFDCIAGHGLRLRAQASINDAQHFRFEHASEPARDASLLLRDGRLSGIFTHLGDARTQLTGLEHGLTRTRFEDATKDLPCSMREFTMPPHDDGALAADPCDDGSHIDLLVVYTSAALTQAGGLDQLNDAILWAVADNNATFVASLISLELRLVDTALVAGYLEDPSDIATDLARLREPNDGVMDEIHALRNSSGADLVALVRADGAGSCGISMIGGSSGATSEFAFSVTMLGCFASRTFTHELGHNLGCCHAPGDGGGCLNGAVFPYSTGHRFFGTNGTQYRTVMAYAPGTRIGHFSSPRVAVQGTASGIVDERDNARSINQTRFVVSNYRCAVCPSDFDEDGSTNAGDLSILLSAWGTAAADLDGDHRTLASDLAILLSNWGACP